MAHLQLVKMSDSLTDPFQSCLRFEELGEVWELRWSLDEIGEGCWAKLESDVEPGVLLLLVEISNDVGVEVGRLEEGDFVGGERGEVGEETFDGDGTRLEGTWRNEGGR